MSDQSIDVGVSVGDRYLGTYPFMRVPSVGDTITWCAGTAAEEQIEVFRVIKVSYSLACFSSVFGRLPARPHLEVEQVEVLRPNSDGLYQKVDS